MIRPDSLPTLAFVIPWYGPDIPGGAENLCREWAEHLVQAGFKVEILTTTIKEFQSNWNKPFYRAGEYLENGVPVRRFGLRPGDHDLFNDINDRLLRGLKISAEEELKFLEENANSDDLVDFITRHRDKYIFFFIPYLFGTTYWGSQAASDRAILIPCLHDECYAYLSPIRDMFTSARGVIFNSHPEQALAERLYGLAQTEKIVLGMGLDSGVRADADAFRKKFRLVQPFLLYVGRKDRTKNTDLLLEYFSQYKRDRRDSRLQLVLVGKGNLQECGLRNAECGMSNSDNAINLQECGMRNAECGMSYTGNASQSPTSQTIDSHSKISALDSDPYIPHLPFRIPHSGISHSAFRIPHSESPQSAIAGDIRDLGFLEAQDKYNAYAAATLLCNPSTNESFSIVLMESWLCGTPVLVNSRCDVTRDFVERSGGGLHFSDFYEFEACMDYLVARPDLRKKMAAAGGEFVRRNYSWDVLIARFTRIIHKFQWKA